MRDSRVRLSTVVDDRPRRSIHAVHPTEVRLQATPDGHYLVAHRVGWYEAWQPYIEAFGGLELVARVGADVGEAVEERADGPGVQVHALPFYSGLGGLVRALPGLRREMSRIGDADTVFILRVAEPLALLLWRRARRLRARYVAMITSDAAQIGSAFIPGLAGRAFGVAFGALARRVVRGASAVVYLSEGFQQTRYPASPGVPQLWWNTTELPEAAFHEPQPRTRHAPLRLVTIGSMSARVKGYDVLWNVMRELRSRDIDVRLDVLGGGALFDEFRADAAAAGLADVVDFAGHLPRPELVRSRLDAADIYVSTSKSEGMPRATLEAMARGLPVTTTAAGAVSELLDAHQLAPIGDVAALADRIEAIARDPELWRTLSARNLSMARRVAEHTGSDRLRDFLVSVFRPEVATDDGRATN